MTYIEAYNMYKQAAQVNAPAAHPSVTPSVATKPAFGQSYVNGSSNMPDLPGTRTAVKGDTPYLYWTQLGGNKHMPWQKWLGQFLKDNQLNADAKGRVLLKPGQNYMLGPGIE